MTTKNSFARRVGVLSGSGVIAAALWLGLGGAMGAAPVALLDPETCLPTCANADGRMLVVAGDDPTTLGNVGLTVGLSFSQASVETLGEDGNFAFFDGDRDRTNFDIPYNDGTINDPALRPQAPQLILELFADPSGAGIIDPVATPPLVTWAAGSLPFVDNTWVGTTFTHDLTAQNLTTLDYNYALRITPANAAVDLGWNAFKVRANGTVLLRADQVIGFIGTPLVGYDGTWTFSFATPANLDEVTFYDGDMDFGAFDCSYNDTDDLDSDVQEIPGTGAANEGIAVATGNSTLCTDAFGVPNGLGTRTGSPPDDNNFAFFRRTPAVGYQGIVYQVVAPPSALYPAGQIFVNRDPSGNREWEQFKIQKVNEASSIPGGIACPVGGFAATAGYVEATDTTLDSEYPASDCRTLQLPGGVPWQIQLDGMDASNLNFWFFNFRVGPTPPDGGDGVIAPTTETCQDYADGTIATEYTMRYSLTGSSKIANSVAPGVIFYFTEVTVGVGDTLSVAQSHTGSAPIFLLHNNEARVYTTSCGSVSATVSQNSTTGLVTFGGLAPGTYILRLKWSGKSLVGAPAPIPSTSDYTFVAQLNGVPVALSANATPLSLVKR